MIPLVILGFSSGSGCSGSKNVPIEASVIGSFEKPKKPKKLE